MTIFSRTSHMVHIVSYTRFKMVYILEDVFFFIFQLHDECHCWWTRESPRAQFSSFIDFVPSGTSVRAQAARFYGRLGLICIALEHQNPP